MNSDNKNDDNNLEIQLHRANTQIQEMDQIIRKLQKQKNKLSKKNQIHQQAIEEMKNEIAEVKTEKSKVLLANQTLSDDVKTLQIELEVCNAAKNELESKVTSLSNVNKKRITSIEAFQQTFESQRKEILTFTQERQTFTQLINKLNFALTITATKYNDAFQELEAIKKSQVKPILFHDLTDISSLIIPFKGEIGKRCVDILKLEQYEPFQRVQLMLNEINKEFSRVNEHEKEMEAKLNHLNEIQQIDQQKSDLLSSLLKGLKALADTERQFDSSAFCEADNAFLDYMISHCNDFYDSQTTQEHFPSDVYVAASFDSRRKAVEQLKTEDQIALALINSLFLFNTKLVEQNRKLIANLVQKKELTKLGKIIGAKSYDEIPQKLEDLLKQIREYKKQKQNIQKVRDNIPVQIVTDNTQANETISQLQEIIAVLKDENQYLKDNSNKQKCSDTHVNDELVLHLRTENAKLSSEKNDIQNLLKDKEAEVEQLQNQIKDNDQAIVNWSLQIQTMNNDRANFEAKIREYQRIITSLEAKLNEMQKKAKKKIKALKRFHIDEKNKLSESYEQVKAMYEQSIESMNHKMDQMRELSRKMSSSQAKCEKRNQELEEQNLQLQTQHQAMTSQLAAISEQSKLDKQKAEERATARMISLENQLQDELGSLKAKVLAQDQYLRNLLVKSIGTRYGIKDSNFSNEFFERLLEKVQNDLKKLQMFQNNGTYEQ
ncbi:hypothetical protein TRFO_30185 [Tritrichomonas foetus]|uniref:Uncharacterized protein n=1 Tax=Tritrichomonas foetus TaxID=1144522 RepID=A0A1J4JYV7_9EUKA|nr:hypothetical protein TRFO_30185 [Tritrichomonas foetus]|eukprot:OHT02686.1 hypothetical protein TRFO_30185 [Tritrichomonas foetus]